MEKTHLVIIDPQNDFCDPKGSLYVDGADQDMSRLSDFIKRAGDKINNISVTLDSHCALDVAHPMFWKDSSGNNPTPFTIISKQDVEDNVWTPNYVSLYQRMLDYVTALEDNNRYPLCIWPPHCLIGSWGHSIYSELYDTLFEWENKHIKNVDFISKGSNPFTEHYSAVKADVPFAGDPSTEMNIQFIQNIEKSDNVIVAGEASSHCVLSTVRDISEEFGVSQISKLVLMTDCMSSVGATPDVDFPKIAQDFQDQMVKDGMRLTTSTSWMAQSASTGKQ